MVAGGSERREPTLVRLSIDPARRRLRESLATVDKWLSDVETPTLHRVRLILGEIVGRSTEDRGEIRIEIVLLPESVRIELVGRALVLPEDPADHDPENRSPFPDWILNDLADRWGVDRRHAAPGIWLLVDRS